MGQGKSLQESGSTFAEISLDHKTGEVAWWRRQARRTRATAPDGKRHQNSSKRNHAQAWEALTRLTRSLALRKARRNCLDPAVLQKQGHGWDSHAEELTQHETNSGGGSRTQR